MAPTFVAILLLHLSSAWQLKDYNPLANSKSVIQSDTVRFTVLTSRLFRLEYDTNGKFEDRQSMSILNRYLDSPQFTHSQNTTHIVIKTDYLELIYINDEPFGANSLQINYIGNDFNFKYIPSGNVSTDNSLSNNMLGTIRSLDEITGSISLNCTENADIEIHRESLHCEWAPIGRNGYALIDDTKTPMFDKDNKNWLAVNNNNDKQDWYFFGYGLQYKQALFDYQSISGSIPIHPRYSYGIMHSRWFDYSDFSMKQVVKSMESRNIPLDIIVFDMNWHLNFDVFMPWGAYTFNPNLIPNPNITQAWFKKKNLRVTANLHDNCGITTHEQYYQQVADALNITNGKDIKPNFTNYDYMIALQDIILQPLHEDIESNRRGFDFWWIDWQQGQTQGIYYSNINPTIWLNYIRVTNHIRRNENIRGFTLGRWGGIGNHRYPVGFSGDVGHTWSTLKFEVYFSSTASNVLYGWSHDIMGSKNDYQLDTRWIQWGAYSTIFRSHDAGHAEGFCAEDPISHDCAEPDIWMHPYKHLEIERDALQQRAALLPYIYNDSYYSMYKNGIQLLRPMYYDYSEIDNAYSEIAMKSQYMFGEKMIISPITTPVDVLQDKTGGVLYDLANQTIWIPPNEIFYELHSGNIYYTQSQNGLFIQRKFDLSEIPIYIKGNSIIPMQPFDDEKVIGRSNTLSYDHIEWNIYPTPTSLINDTISEGTAVLYEDDGISYNYLQDKNVLTTFKWNYDINSYVLNTSVISNGNYDGFENERMHSIKIHNILPPNKVSCNGKLLNYNPLWYGFENEEGWFYNGIDIAVVVNCPQIDAFKTNTINMEFDSNTDWFNKNSMEMIQGIKGKINRAILCKQSLDERNTAYGNERNNLTIAAGYSMSLSNNYQNAYSSMIQFENIYDSAIKQVTDLLVEDVGQQRKKYCLNILNTINKYL